MNNSPTALTKEQFDVACAKAEKVSADEGCSVHVNVGVSIVNGLPTVTHVTVSDWYVDGSTVRTYSNGRER